MRHASVLLSLAFGLILFHAPLHAAEPVIDLTQATVLTPPGLGGPEQKAVQMLIEEVEKRSRVRWERRNDWPKSKESVVLVGQAAGVRSLAGRHGIELPNELGEGGREGFRLGCTREKEAPTVWVAGNDERGVLFGVGRLLRELRMERDRITLPTDFQIATAPRTPLRGHQVG